jgi:hypothetical protein
VKSRIWLIAGFVLVFCLGTVAGGAAVAGSHARHQAAQLHQPGRGSFGALLARLKLRPEQRATIDTIVGRYELDRGRIMAPVLPAVRDRRAAMRQEVRATLDANQAADFDNLTRELDENRARRASHAAAAPSAATDGPGASNR